MQRHHARSSEGTFAQFMARRKWKHINPAQRNEVCLREAQALGVVMRLHDDTGTFIVSTSITPTGLVIQCAGGVASTTATSCDKLILRWGEITSATLEEYAHRNSEQDSQSDDDDDLRRSYFCVETIFGDVLLFLPQVVPPSTLDATIVEGIEGIEYDVLCAQLLSSETWLDSILPFISECAGGTSEAVSPSEFQREVPLDGCGGSELTLQVPPLSSLNPTEAALQSHILVLQRALETKQHRIARLAAVLEELQNERCVVPSHSRGRTELGLLDDTEGNNDRPSSRPRTAGGVLLPASAQLADSALVALPERPTRSSSTLTDPELNDGDELLSFSGESSELSSNSRGVSLAQEESPLRVRTAPVLGAASHRYHDPQGNDHTANVWHPPTRASNQRPEVHQRQPAQGARARQLVRDDDHHESSNRARMLGLGSLEPPVRRREDVANDAELLQTFDDIHGGGSSSDES